MLLSEHYEKTSRRANLREASVLVFKKELKLSGQDILRFPQPQRNQSSYKSHRISEKIDHPDKQRGDEQRGHVICHLNLGKAQKVQPERNNQHRAAAN